MSNRLGLRYGRLTVIAEAEPARNHQRRWLCRCDCGTEKVVQGSNLQSGGTRSCGCLLRENMSERTKTHGDTSYQCGGRCVRRTTEYTAWAQMKQRCYNPADSKYARYGGRGIRVCDEWRHDFSAFLAHIGRKPNPKYSIDRMNNDGDYEPGNVRWSTRSEQQQNRANTRTVVVDGNKIPIAALARRCGIERRVLARRILDLGWSIERAMTTPLGPRGFTAASSRSDTPK